MRRYINKGLEDMEVNNTNLKHHGGVIKLDFDFV